MVTFADHTAGVTDICFTQSGKAVLSASLEGCVRAHDLKRHACICYGLSPLHFLSFSRYRNFRTMVAPKQTQLSSLCADKSGDLVGAASKDQYEIYIWV